MVFLSGDNIEDINEQVIDQRLKVIIVGEPGAGKHEVAKGTDVCIPFKSLGVSIGKKMNMNSIINYKLTLIFWTLTYGRPKSTTYFEGSSAAIIVGNLNTQRNLSDMGAWADKIIAQLGWIPIYFIGTVKSKRNSQNTQKRKKLAKLAKSYNSNYFVFSPNKINSLKNIFKNIAEDLARKYYRILKNSESV